MARRQVTRRDFSNLAGMRIALYCRVSQDRESRKRREEDPDYQAKSVNQQLDLGRQWVERVGGVLVGDGEYLDTDRSASEFATKDREEFERLKTNIRGGGIDVVWFWELSRSQRDMTVFEESRQLNQTHGVAWSINGTIYNFADHDAVMTLRILTAVAAHESGKTSDRILRDTAAKAHRGRPHGRINYGYRRRLDPVTEEAFREPDTWDGDGQPIEKSPAWIVRELFRRVAAGEALTRIASDLNARGIPLPRGPLTGKSRWRASGIRRIVLSPAYIAKRVYNNKVLPDVVATWPPLVDEETFWRVQQRLNDPERPKTRPARAKSLLSCLVTCGKCGDYVAAKASDRKRNGTARYYGCLNHGCVGIRLADLDDYVEDKVIRMLEDPELFAKLTEVDDSAVAAQARADAGEARSELEQWRQLIDRGEIAPAAYARAERGLLARIEEADKRARASTMPPGLGGVVGPDAERAWNAAPLEVKRTIIATMAEITLLPSGRPAGTFRWADPIVGERVEWCIRVGPNAGMVVPAAPRSVVLPRGTAAVLTEIARNGSLRQTELQRVLGTPSRGTVSATVVRLLEQGLVTREAVPHGDGKPGRPTFTLTLTDTGRQALADAGVDAG